MASKQHEKITLTEEILRKKIIRQIDNEADADQKADHGTLVEQKSDNLVSDESEDSNLTARIDRSFKSKERLVGKSKSKEFASVQRETIGLFRDRSHFVNDELVHITKVQKNVAVTDSNGEIVSQRRSRSQKFYRPLIGENNKTTPSSKHTEPIYESIPERAEPLPYAEAVPTTISGFVNRDGWKVKEALHVHFSQVFDHSTKI